MKDPRFQIMTETSAVPDTYSTSNLFPVTAPTATSTSPAPNGTQPQVEDEEEPYTIKCICAFEDDDGSTVFCERCETWQHIVCYYHHQDVPEVHNCADCEPRPLDGKRATERQKTLREQSEGSDRKGKRSGSKAQKRKTKENATPTEQSNGVNPQDKGASNAPQKDQPPQTKKSRHRATASTSSATGAAERKRRSSTATSTNQTKNSSIAPQHPYIPLYSHEFIHLYDHDQVGVDMQGNLFDTLGLAGDLASWVQDPTALAQVSQGRHPNEVFTHSDLPLDSSKWPTLTKQTSTDTSVEIEGRHPMWQYLKLENSVQKDQIVGEVRGKVGHFRDYCLDPNSRWAELRHPEPFVFFHPQLPIYIDSRQEGTQLRYIRRSCRPNVTMKTYVTNQVEYHFCMVANQNIPENTEITTTWYLDPQVFPSNGKLVKQDGTNDDISDTAAIAISNVLAHFGGCACDPSQQCLLSKVDLRRSPKSFESISKQTNGKRKRSKPKPTVSPISTGRATNSRAGSEAAKNHEDEDATETRSTSGSARGQPRSRDMSPTGTNQAVTDGLSAREKRKLAAVEKKFEQLENHQQHNQKKKKRAPSQGQNSVGVNNVSPIQNSSVTVPPLKPHYSDPNVSRSSHSPTKMSPRPNTSGQGSQISPTKTSNTPRVGSPLSRRVYVDSSMQTEPDENDPQYVPAKPVRRFEFVPLTKRLLKRCHEDRMKLEDLGQRDGLLNNQKILNVPFNMVSTGTPTKSPISPPHGAQGDVEMKDADTAITPPKRPPSLLPGPSSVASDEVHSPSVPEPPGQPSLHPLPSTAAHNIRVPRKPFGDLRVQLPTSQFAASSSSMPQSATKMSPPSLLQTNSGLKSQASPADTGSSVAGPSPAKKKLTLGDYMSRRGTLMTPTTEKSQPQLPPAGQTPSSGTVEGSSPTTTLPSSAKLGEQIKQESPATPDVVMKDVQMSSMSGEMSPSFPRDPRLQSHT